MDLNGYRLVSHFNIIGILFIVREKKLSKVDELATTYGDIFNFCAYLAVFPYIETFRFCAGIDHNNLFLGVGACLFFSTFVPILPEVTSFTFSAASFLVALSLIVGMVAFPLAMFVDLVEGNAFQSIALCKKDGLLPPGEGARQGG